MTLLALAAACTQPTGTEAEDDRLAAAQTETNELQDCGYVLVTTAEPAPAFDALFTDERVGTVEPGAVFKSTETRSGCHIVEREPGNWRSRACLRPAHVLKGCGRGIETKPYVALRDTHLLTGAPLTATEKRACRIPTGALLAFDSWGSGGSDVPAGYLRVTLADDTLPECSVREGLIDRADLGGPGEYYVGPTTPELQRINEARRAAGLRGDCEAPQTRVGGVCTTVAVPMQCRPPSVLTPSGDDCRVPSTDERGLRVGAEAIVHPGSIASFWRAKVARIEGESVIVRGVRPTGPYAYEVSERAFPMNEVEVPIEGKGQFRTGDTYVADEGGERRVYRVEVVTDVGNVYLSTKTLEGPEVTRPFDAYTLAEAERQLGGATKVTTELRPGDTVEYDGALFGLATVVEQRGQSLRISYEKIESGRPTRQTADVARKDVRPQLRELDGVRVDDVYLSTTRVTLAARVEAIRSDGTLSVVYEDAVARQATTRTTTLADLKAAFDVTP